MIPDRFQLAIIGGCAASQRGIPLSRLYHRIVSARWKATYGVRMHVILDRYDQSTDYAARVKNCLAHRAPHAVLIHVRPSPFLVRCKPLIKYADASGRIKWVLHPRLFPLTGRAWNPIWDGATVIGTQSASMDPSQDRLKEIYPPCRNSRLRSLHVFLGATAGLAAWARREEIHALRRAASLCSASGIPLFVLGPTPFPRSPMGNRLCMELSEMLRKEAAAGQMHFIDPIRKDAPNPRGFLMPDLWHLSEAGHAEMADSIFRVLEATCPSSTGR